MLPRSYDLIGSIAILKFPQGFKIKEKRRLAKALLNSHKNVKTILEKEDRVKGRLRTVKTNYLAGKDTRETLHMESACKLKLDIVKCYFSPRLSNERIEIARQIKRNKAVIVLFGGVAPYAIVIAKNSKAKEIVSIELGKECNKYARENIKLNKLYNVELIQGDVKRIVPKIKKKFDYIIAARPQLKESFLTETFLLSKKGTKIFYYAFAKEDNLDKIKKDIKEEGKKQGKRVKFLKIKKAGEIAPYKSRWRIDFEIV